jgi:hypothetical protein
MQLLSMYQDWWPTLSWIENVGTSFVASKVHDPSLQLPRKSSILIIIDIYNLGYNFPSKLKIRFYSIIYNQFFFQISKWNFVRLEIKFCFKMWNKILHDNLESRYPLKPKIRSYNGQLRI